MQVRFMGRLFVPQIQLKSEASCINWDTADIDTGASQIPLCAMLQGLHEAPLLPPPAGPPPITTMS